MYYSSAATTPGMIFMDFFLWILTSVFKFQ